MNGLYPRLRGLHHEGSFEQQLSGGDDFPHDFAGTLLPRHRGPMRHFPPPAAKLNLSGTDDPHWVVYRRRQPQHGVTWDRLTAPIS